MGCLSTEFGERSANHAPHSLRRNSADVVSRRSPQKPIHGLIVLVSRIEIPQTDEAKAHERGNLKLAPMTSGLVKTSIEGSSQKIKGQNQKWGDFDQCPGPKNTALRKNRWVVGVMAR